MKWVGLFLILVCAAACAATCCEMFVLAERIEQMTQLDEETRMYMNGGAKYYYENEKLRNEYFEALKNPFGAVKD